MHRRALPLLALFVLGAGAAEARPRRAPARRAALKAESVEIAVIGAGLSGETAAYFLRDRDVVVLEKEPEFGGKVRRQDWDDAQYPVGAMYMAKPEGLFKRVLKELKLRGLAVPKPYESLFTAGGDFIVDPYGKGLPQLPAGDDDKDEIRRMTRDMREIALDPKLQMPPAPDKDAVTPRLKELDGQDFWSFMERRYGPASAKIADSYALSYFGAGAREVSALAGIPFFAWDIADRPNVTWKGGPGVISEAMIKAVGKSRFRAGAAVVSVERSASGVEVAYTQDGEDRRLNAKAAVIAVPSPVALKIVKNLPAVKAAALGQVRYAPFVVAALSVAKPLYGASFYLSSGIDTIFNYLAFPAWPERRKRPESKGQLVLAHIPMGPGSGRSGFRRDTDAELERRIVADVDRIFPGAKDSVQGVRLHRWPLAFGIPAPGYLTGGRFEVAAPVGPLFFAGADRELPAIEGAIASGHSAAAEARLFLDK